MYRGKRVKRNRKAGALLVSLLLVVCVAVGGTLAFLTARTNSVVNTFTPSKITTEVAEKFENNVKTNVKIKNTGDTTAWIRAAVVITWQDEGGNVYGQTPVENTDYTITYDLKNGWVKGADGFYYWTKPVEAGKLTEALITECKPKTPSTAPEDYFLTVEIVGSGIQYKPANVFNDNWDSSGLKVDADGNSLVEVKKGGGGN